MKKIISVLLTVLFLAVVSGASADTALLKLKDSGIIEGFEDGELHPEIILTRAQFAKIMANTFPETITTEILYDFDDLATSHWAFSYIQKAVNAGWIKGFPDNTVRPDDVITFEQATAVVCRALGLSYDYFEYPYDYIAKAIDYSVTDGVNSTIGEAINRSEAAKIIVNALNYENLQKTEKEAMENTVSVIRDGLKGYSVSSPYIAKVGGSASVSVEKEIQEYEESGAIYDNYYEPFSIMYNTEEYNSTDENVFKNSVTSPLSTFSIDTDTASYSKLPLVKLSLSMLLDRLHQNDRISIVTYASGTKVVLEPTNVSEKEKIISAMNSLYPYGSTFGEGGIELAYEQAEKYKIDGNNRVILCTDGDFNIGRSSDAELDKLISEKRESGIFLSVLGFGMGNYKDNKMETLADKGNGNYAYIDNLREAKKVLVDEMPKTIYTIAKDVKIQTEFNPEKVAEYRLIGYENRTLNNEDFDNDKKDAGELGAGATVTVLYEIVPQKAETKQSLKYQTTETTGSDDLMSVKIRYKTPEGDTSILYEYSIPSDINVPTNDFNFAAAVAELGMIINNSEFKGNADYDSVTKLARSAVGDDIFGLRSEFIQLVDLLKYRENN